MTTIYYFGYGSNMDLAALKAKGVTPIESRKAQLSNWQLRFSVEHFFRHEGGVGNIKKTGDSKDSVCGVLHLCSQADLAALDRLEGYGVGYDRIEVEVETDQGSETAYTYVGLPAYVNDACLPTQRYVNMLVRGARAAGIDPDYVKMIENHATIPTRLHPPFDPDDTGAVIGHEELEEDQTVLAGHVFSMKQVRFAHELARDWFGGKDVTQFHLRRMEKSTGEENLRIFLDGKLTPDQHEFLNTYLYAFNEEYQRIGKFDYTGLPQSKILS